ncbi:AAA family ATPase [Nocardia sp. NPDC058058]|uniref:caspase, EACC1-associated type n=1 Tax=Nocardia sp. NPDC058058 TaxID=3346317 RepID=UPI0036DA11BC
MNTVRQLESVFVEVCGVDRSNLTTLVDPDSREVLYHALKAAANGADDVLLLYYIGHGLVSPTNELHLSTSATTSLTEDLPVTALGFSAVRDAVARNRIRSIVVVLDCCFAGRARGAVGSALDDAFAFGGHSGSYVLGAAAPQVTALVDDQSNRTAFSGAAVDLLRDGDPDGPPRFTLEHMFAHLHSVLPQQHPRKPPPYRQAIGTVGDIVLADNRAYRPPVENTVEVITREAADQICPYQGLVEFGVADAPYYFGRDRAVAELTRKLAQRYSEPGLVAVVGASGTGKSSLLRAGLIPALRRDAIAGLSSRTWPIIPCTPTAKPLEALVLAVSATADVETMRARLVEDPAVITSMIRDRFAASMSVDARAVIIIDRLEELYTACESGTERDIFIRALGFAAMGKNPAALVIVGLRADFYSHCLAYPILAEALSDCQLTVRPMTELELRDAIEKPAEVAGYRLEPGLADQIVTDMRLGTRSAPDPGGALPLLSYALTMTWHQRRGRILTLRGYRDSGGIEGAVAKVADRIHDELQPAELRAMRLLLLLMVRVGQGTEHTRRRLDVDNLFQDHPNDDATAIRRVLDSLAAPEARLITLDHNYAEITHEALIWAWPTLRAWITQDRDALLVHNDLATTTDHWRVGHDPAYLYSGNRLAAAQSLQTNPALAGLVAGKEREFLRASSDDERRRARRTRQVVALLTVLLLVAVSAGGYAFIKQNEAVNEYQDATILRLGSESESILGGIKDDLNANGAIQRLLAAHAIDPDMDAGPLMNALVEMQGVMKTLPTRVTSVVFSHDGTRIASAGKDGVRLFDAQTKLPVAELMSAQGAVNSVAFSPDGTQVVAGGQDGTVRIWDPQHPERLGKVIAKHDQQVTSVAFSRTGTRVASGGEDGTVRIWDPQHPDRDAVTIARETKVSSVALSPDGQRVVWGGQAGVKLMDLQTGISTSAPMSPAALPPGAVNSVAFSPDGRLIASGGNDEVVRLWDVTHADPVATRVLDRQGGPVLGVAFDEFWPRVTSAGWDGTVREWDIETGVSLGGGPIGRHRGAVTSVSSSPTEPRIVSGGDDGTLRLWDRHLGPEGIVMDHVERNVLGVAFNPNPTKNTIATANWDGRVRLWDLSGDKPKEVGEQFEAHNGAANTVAFSGDGGWVVSGGDDGAVRLWNGETGKPQEVLFESTSPVRSVAATGDPAGLRIAFGTDDGSVRIWDARTRTTHILSGSHQQAVKSVAFSSDGHRMVTGSLDGTVRFWNADTGAPNAEQFDAHTPIFSVAFSLDGHVAAGGKDGKVQLLDPDGTPHPPLEGHKGQVNSVAFTDNGKHVVSAGWDGTVRIWDVASRHPVGAAIDTRAGPVFAAAPSADGRTIATGRDGNVQLWDAAGRSAGVIPYGGQVWALAFAPKNIRRLASIGDDGVLRLWDTATGKLKKMVPAHHGTGFGVAYSDDGKYIVTSGRDGAVRIWDADKIWDAKADQHIDPLQNIEVKPPTSDPGKRPISAAVFDRDGTRIVSVGNDGKIRIWDAKTGKLLREWAAKEARVFAVAFSPDGKRIITGGEDGAVYFWDAGTGESQGQMTEGQKGFVFSVAFSPTGDLIASGAADRYVRIWDTAAKSPVGKQPGGQGDSVTQVAFTPDSKYIISASHDGIVRVWDAIDHTPIGRQLVAGPRFIQSLAISPDGLQFASGYDEGTIRLWPSPTSFEDVACNLVANTMSRDEWNELISDKIRYRRVCTNPPKR